MCDKEGNCYRLVCDTEKNCYRKVCDSDGNCYTLVCDKEGNCWSKVCDAKGNCIRRASSADGDYQIIAEDADGSKITTKCEYSSPPFLPKCIQTDCDPAGNCQQTKYRFPPATPPSPPPIPDFPAEPPSSPPSAPPDFPAEPPSAPPDFEPPPPSPPPPPIAPPLPPIREPPADPPSAPPASEECYPGIPGGLACPPGHFLGFGKKGGCRTTTCETGQYTALRGITTFDACAERCLDDATCKAFEWFPRPRGLLPSRARCEIHRDVPVKTAADCGETGQALDHCCCTRA